MSKFNFTKQDLINWGISVDNTDTGEYIVSAPYIVDYKKGRYVGKKRRVMNEHDVTTKHKYGLDRTYKMYVIGIKDGEKSKQRAFLTHRLVWVWFNGDIPDQYDVDHIDDNPINNDISNLQLLSRKDNLTKRLLNDNDVWNQYMAIKKYGDK